MNKTLTQLFAMLVLLCTMGSGQAAYTFRQYIPGLAAAVAAPSTSDPYWNNVALLTHMDGTGSTVIDQKGHTFPSSGAVTQLTTNSKFGGGSAYFNGSSSLHLPNSADFNFSNGDFTLEGWVYPTVTSSTGDILTATDATQRAPFHVVLVSGILKFYSATASLSAWDISSGQVIGTPPVNTWSHWAVTRNGNNFYLAMNGTITTTFTSSLTLADVSLGLSLGANASNAENFMGYADDVRITKGIARYTANFTPATTAFPNQ